MSSGEKHANLTAKELRERLWKLGISYSILKSPHYPEWIVIHHTTWGMFFEWGLSEHAVLSALLEHLGE
jgi:hypothetical protein